MADTLYQQLREHAHHLRLSAVADRLAGALEAAERDKPPYTQFLADLLAAEIDAVEQRRLQGRLRFAKLPARKTLEQFDFSAHAGLDRRLVEDLATLRFIEDNANALLIGPHGVGKTMLATILGHRAVEAGYRVYYATAADLVARTAKADLEGRWATRAGDVVARERGASASQQRHVSSARALDGRRPRWALAILRAGRALEPGRCAPAVAAVCPDPAHCGSTRGRSADPHAQARHDGAALASGARAA